ncbi:MAG: 16S rRNA (cytidine(1402)-2'-O)-methyltransferase [Ahrensia sp.]|nr:16S rRNA (cytidine(1402)-2'-O)-methyltransferase [Ahrensia sp.]
MASTFTIRDTTFLANPLEAGLYCVATPIGNLGDITIRALEVLAACDVIACEDTRTSGVLLKRYGIDRPKLSYNEHNADHRGQELLGRIENGGSVALISDAGTPLINDPGTRLVQAAIEYGLAVFPLPGASAPLAALVGSGLAPDDFRFLGFLPSRSGARRSMLENLQSHKGTLLFFESPKRLVATLQAMADVFGEDRRAVVARELTKMHETFHRGTLAQLLAEFSNAERVRGEIVIAVEAGPGADVTTLDIEAMLTEALASMKTKDAASHVAGQTGLPRQELYKRALQLTKRDE